MKNIVVSLLLLLSLQVAGQSVINENRFSNIGEDNFNDIIKLKNSYYSVGYSDKYSLNVAGNVYSDAILAKINQDLDTNWLRPQTLYGRFGKMCSNNDTSFWVGVVSEIAPYAFHLQLKDTNGLTIKELVVRNFVGFDLFQLLLAKDGGIVCFGRILSASGTGNTYDMYVMKIEAQTGLVLWSSRFNDHPYTQGFHIESTPRGTYLASGTAGSRIWAIEIDSNGSEIRRQTFYQSPTRHIFDQGAVQQSADGRFIVNGYYGRRPYYYLGSYDDFSSSTRIWGSERPGLCLGPILLDDGSMVVYSAPGAGRAFSKYNADSTVVWERNLNSRLGAVSLGLNAYAFNADSSVTAVGTIYYNDPSSLDFYIVKIANAGVPYDPTTPMATRPQLGSKGGISIWPQPASHANGGTLHFGGFAGPATLGLYNMRGQQVLHMPGTAGTTTTALLPRQPVPIGHLPAGLYVYRLVAKDRVWTGKVVISE